MFGYSENELLNTTMKNILNKIHKDNILDIITKLKVNTVSKNSNTVLEYKYFHKNGNYIWREDNLNFIYDKENKNTKIIIVARDISERVEKQNQLQTLTNVTADQNQRLLNFTYIISHNIRSHSANLNGLINLHEISDNEIEKNSLFNMLKTSTEKLEETIQNLNEIISVQNNLNQVKAILNLKNELERTFLVVHESILESNVTINNTVDESLEVKVIPAYLDSILLNLITNAIKYKSNERPLIINISAKLEGKFMVLYVQDNGLGLDLIKHKEKLFGMYKTFHNNANSRGIGLFITKNQIEAMKGKIAIESEVNVGTTFKIYFKV
jgi:PAS domain S-box-containing protein